MGKTIEVDWQTRQQIAFWAGVFGAIAALVATAGSQGEHSSNPLVVGVVGFVVCSVISLISRAVGLIIVLISSSVILRSCS